MIQYTNGSWLRVSNSSVWKSDNEKYIKEVFPEYSGNRVLGDRTNSFDSQISGKDILETKEISGEVPEMKLKNFYIDKGGYKWLLCHYIDEFCRMEQINMDPFPEISKEMKEKFYVDLNAAIAAGGELIHISNKGMGKVLLPGGSLVRRDSDSKALLPDGRVAESTSFGSGRNFGYSWNTTESKLDAFASSFDWWNWVVCKGQIKMTTAVFGCRHGEPDTL